MITLTSARRRADELAAALDDPSAPALRPEVAELVGVADALRAHAAAEAPALVPRADFTARLREQLLAEAAESWAYDPSAARLELRARTGSPRRERRLVVAATALVLAGGSAGMAAAAQQALPGEALYPVKRGLEEVRADLTSDDAARGRTLLQQADSRLAEVRALVDESATEPAIASTLSTYRAQALAGSDLLIASYEDERDESTVSEVRGFTRDGRARIEELSSVLPPELADELAAASTLLEEIDGRASDACPTCQPPSARALPVSFEPAVDDATRVLASLEGAAELQNDHPLISPRIAPPTTVRSEPRTGAGGSPADPPPARSDGLGSRPTPEAADGLVDELTGEVGGGAPGGGDLDRGGADARELDTSVDRGAREVEKNVRKGAEGLSETVDGAADDLGLSDTRLP